MYLIGNRQTFGFEVLPVSPSWRTHYAPEAAGWAGTAIWVGGENLCSHFLPGSSEVREFLFVPLGPIADWIVSALPALEFEERLQHFPTTRRLHHLAEEWSTRRPPAGVTEDAWLDAREAWWTRHFLAAGAEGARLPNLALARDDEKLALDWVAPRHRAKDSPVLIHQTGEYNLPWAEGHSILVEIVTRVASWLQDTPTAAVYDWSVDPAAFLAARPSSWDAIELYTGRPLTELQLLFGVSNVRDLRTALRLPDRASDPATSVPCQVLRDLSPQVDQQLGDLLVRAAELSSSSPGASHRTWIEARSLALDAARSGIRPEEAGQLAARSIRQVAGLDGQPIGDVKRLLWQFGVTQERSLVQSAYDRMIVAASEDGAPVVEVLDNPRTGASWGERFEGCRALGNVLLDPIRAGALGAASGPFTAETRRRRSGAFAAELLLPDHALDEASEGKLDGATEESTFTRLLETYGVGARTAAFQLWNHGWLSSEGLRDELILDFSSHIVRN